MKRIVLPLGGLLPLPACGGSYQARDMDLKTTRVNPSLLKKGAGDQALYRYMNTNASVRGSMRPLSTRSR